MKNSFKKIIYYLFSSYLIRKGKSGNIYITFDDGPHPKNTPKILDVLDLYNIKATFFMLGHEMENHPEVVRDVISRGHTLGYHSYDHLSMKEISVGAIFSDLNYAKILSKSFDYNIKIYRPPYGDLSITGIIWVILNSWKIIMWSKDSRDSFDSKDEIVANVSTDKLCSGEILLFHDDYKNTAEVLKDILKSYSKEKINCATF